MGGCLESRCIGRVYGADGAVHGTIRTVPHSKLFHEEDARSNNPHIILFFVCGSIKYTLLIIYVCQLSVHPLFIIIPDNRKYIDLTRVFALIRNISTHSCEKRHQFMLIFVSYLMLSLNTPFNTPHMPCSTGLSTSSITQIILNILQHAFHLPFWQKHKILPY